MAGDFGLDLLGHEAKDFEYLLSNDWTLETHSATMPEILETYSARKPDRNFDVLFSTDVTETVGASDSATYKAEPESVQYENA